jgi:ATP-dependent RNA helicase HelY
MSVADYLESKPFQADPFQWDAAEAIESGRNVVVTAPTGSGKTLVAEVAVYLALERGKRIFYTTPIKALSNQKFGDLIAEHGADRVGLLTGDNAVNGSAPIVVMTTEVLRNMIYADANALGDLGFVILDEVHYLQDRFRGAVWEEVIIHAPRHIQFVCLSATIANAKEFSAWIAERRGNTRLVQTWDRPVPLESMYLMSDRMRDGDLRLFPMFTTREGRTRTNSKLEHLLGSERGRRSRFGTPRRIATVEYLARENMLPAIFFIFSRAGCSAAALSMVESGVRLIDSDARERVRAIAEERTAHLSDSDLGALEYGRWLAGLEAGVSAHHAGLVPAFKETVEELFATGLLKVVFATETLALGINMPARTVVIENLSKYDGESHSLLGPGDYTQLTGRAGRRGIDDQGFGVVLHSRFVDFRQVVKIAEAGAHPLTSSFRPTYNMAANLVANYEQDRAEELLNASFAQYLRGSDEDGYERSLAEMEDRLVDEQVRAECHLGDVGTYVELLDSQKNATAGRITGRLHAGDVISIPGGSREGRYLVLRKVTKGKKNMRFLVLSTSGKTSTVGERDLIAGTVTLGAVRLPENYRPNDRSFQQNMLRQIRKYRDVPAPTERVVRETVTHPVGRCPEASAHVSSYRKAQRTARRIEQIKRKLRSEGVGLVREFRAIEELLADWGYLDGWSLTPCGERLRFVYNELDLLLTESVERGLLWSLTPEDFVALVSAFVFEPRTDTPSEPEWPNEVVEERFEAILALWEELTELEKSKRIVTTRRPDAGFALAAHQWASGIDLDDLSSGTMAPGDFVRVSRQLVDLMQQLRDTFSELYDEAQEGLRLVDRGVVRAQGAM